MAFWKHLTEGTNDKTPSGPGGANDFTAYIMVRFMSVLVAVLVVESLVVWIESLVFLPVLQGLLNGFQEIDLKETTSILSLLYWLFQLVFAIASARYAQVAGLAARSFAVVLLVVSLALLALPPFAGAVVFSRMVANKVRELEGLREEELANNERQRSQFITDIAHDLRTPLMAISGMSHAITDGVVPDEEMRDEYLRSIGEKADKMGELVSSVFDYAKLGSGAFSLERERIDLSQLLLREAANVYDDIEEASMSFSVHVDEERCDVYADPLQLGRVVNNLLVNAMRHNAAGTEIALMLVRKAGVAYVMVADTGEAIPGNPDDLFQPFSRGDAARSDTGGSGLGLSICKRIADMHGYDLALVQPYGRFAKAFVLRCTVE